MCNTKHTINPLLLYGIWFSHSNHFCLWVLLFGILLISYSSVWISSKKKFFGLNNEIHNMNSASPFFLVYEILLAESYREDRKKSKKSKHSNIQQRAQFCASLIQMWCYSHSLLFKLLTSFILNNEFLKFKKQQQ